MNYSCSSLLTFILLSFYVSFSGCNGAGKSESSGEGKTVALKSADEELLVCRKDNKNGFINLQGEWVIASKYDIAYPFLDGISLVSLNGKYILIDKKENHVPLPAEAVDISTFMSGLASFKNAEGKTGFINRKGKVMVQPEYDAFSLPTEGMWILVKNELYFYTDSTGHILGEPGFELAYIFSGGLAPVTVKGKNGYINTSGEWVIKPQYDYAGNFSEGLAMVGTGTADKMKYSFIDKTGKEMFPAPYKSVYPTFNKGLTYFRVEEGGGVKYGIMNSRGETVVAPKYDRVEDLVDEHDSELNIDRGYFRTQIGDKYGITTAEGIVEPAFSSIANFHEGLAAASIKENGQEKFGYIDTSGKWMIQPTWVGAQDFAFGVAAVSPEKDKWGYINKTGKMVIEPQYSFAYQFLGDIAFVLISGNTAVINREGKVLIRE